MDDEKIVGRAELKLAKAVEAFGYDFRGKTVLDIGSSTGGFTELTLKMGAKKVYAVEKGTKQMKAPLRFDNRVELHEKTDIFDVIVDEKDDNNGNVVDGKVKLEEYPQVIVADVSFISLLKVMKYVKKYLANKKTDFLVMMKPQFEAEEYMLNRGVVKNEKMRREIIKKFEAGLKREGFVILKKRDNELRGKVGKNLERFYWLKLAK